MEFLLPMPVYRICGVCSVVPSLIFSLECGHVFCPSCMSELRLNSAVTICPIDKRAFEDTSVSRDPSSADYVTSCKCFCINKSSGCNYVGPLSQMTDHFDAECNFHRVQCRICKSLVARANVLDHVRGGCTTGPFLCGRAKSAASTSGAANGGSDAEGISTLLSKVDNLERLVIARTRDIQEILVGSREERQPTRSEEEPVRRGGIPVVPTHREPSQTAQPVQNGTSSPVPATEDAAVPAAEAGADTAAETTAESVQDSPSPTAQPNSPSTPAGANSASHECSPTNTVPQEAATAAPPEPQAEGNAVTLTQPPPLMTFQWDIKPFRKYRHAPSLVFKSEPFFIGSHGYMARLEGKFHEVNGSTLVLGLYVRLQRGPHDAKLEWPFNKKCTFVLLHAKHHHRNLLFTLGDSLEEEEMQNAANTSFSRPQRGENEAVGIDNCVTATQILQGGFVKDNTVKIRFEVR